MPMRYRCISILHQCQTSLAHTSRVLLAKLAIIIYINNFHSQLCFAFLYWAPQQMSSPECVEKKWVGRGQNKWDDYVGVKKMANQRCQLITTIGTNWVGLRKPVVCYLHGQPRLSKCKWAISKLLNEMYGVWINLTMLSNQLCAWWVI